MEAKVSVWSRATRIYVNGVELRQSAGPRKNPWRVWFMLGHHAATLVSIAYGRASTQYDLVVDGRSVTTGGQPRPPANPYESTAMSWALLIVVSAILAGVVWFGALPEVRLAIEGREVAALVIGKHQVSGRGTTYHLTYSFATVTGELRQADGRVDHATYSAIRPGDHISVVYVPSEPQIQRPESFDERWAIVALAVMFGGMLLFSAVMVWRAQRLRSITAAVAERGIRTSAIVGGVKRQSFFGQTMRVVYEYTDLEGRSHKGTSPLLYTEEATGYQQGSAATIAYDPNAPGHSIWIGSADPNATVWKPLPTEQMAR